MLTVLFASLGSFAEEISFSIIKFKTVRGEVSIYTAGFINMLFGVLVFGALAIIRGSFLFSFASLPTFSLRVVLEIAQVYVAMLATMKADRSTYAFIRNLTIPLLLLVSWGLGYSVSLNQWMGIAVISLVLAIILITNIINTKGIWYSLFIAINAVATISLFKYNISHFNSVEGEELVLLSILLIFFLIGALFKKENPLVFLKNKIFVGQGAAYAVAAIFEVFAISFGNPGIATAAQRSAAVLAAIVSGHSYFQETKLWEKIIVCLLLVVGLILLAF